MNGKLLFIIVLLVSSISFSQVGIGTRIPDTSAVLDITAADKGVLFPKIALKNYKDSTTIVDPAVGLVVYNTGLESTFNIAGFHYWNGEEWKRLIYTNSYPAKIDVLQCVEAALNPPAYVAGEYYEGTLIIPYVGGNGGIYTSSSIRSTTNGTLTYFLQGGQLNYGSGTVIFTVKGVPAVSSPQLTNFNIDFSDLSCVATVGNANKTEYISFTSYTGSINSNTIVNSVTTLGNLTIRYNGANAAQVGYLEFTPVEPTFLSWVFRKAGAGGTKIRSYGQVNAIPGNWYRLGANTNTSTDFNSVNRDMGKVNIISHNTQEIYRINAAANRNLTSSGDVPAKNAAIYMYLERLGE